MNVRILLLTLAVVLMVPALVYSQFDLKYIPQDAYEGNTERPKVFFPHDRHNKLAGLDGDDQCYICHHVFDDGVLVTEDNSAGIPCADCHLVDEVLDGAPKLTDAYHLSCMGCHDEMNRGPITCGQCHSGEATGPTY